MPPLNLRLLHFKILSNFLFFLLFSSLTFLSCERRYNSSSETDKVETKQDSVNTSLPKDKIDTVSFYLENSGSVDGYLSTQGSNFHLTVSRLAFALSSLSETQQYYFANTTIHPLEVNQPSEFIDLLNQNDIRVGDRSISKLNDLLDEILSRSTDHHLSAFISDGIYSINGQLKLASEETYFRFKNRLEKTQFNVLLLKLNSKFKGLYYPAAGGEVSIDQNRPFYIWLVGSAPQLKLLEGEIIINQLPGYVNHHMFFLNNSEGMYYSVHPSFNTFGFNYSRSQNPSAITSINNPEIRNGKFTISVGIDFSKLPINSDYYLNKDNYSIQPEQFSIESIVPLESLPERERSSVRGSETHFLIISSTGYPVGKLKINLLKRTPNWVVKSGTLDDSDIDSLSTFGFQFLVEGIERAYDRVAGNNNYIELKINIEK
jgi:hypothetical protein